MKDINWDILHEGFLLCLVLQIFIIGIFKIFSSSFRNRILGLFSLLIVIHYHGIFFEPGSGVSELILKGQYEIFYGPILYVYIAALKKQSKELLRHLFFPTVYFLSFKVIRVFLNGFYEEYKIIMGIAHFLFIPFYLVFYFKKGISEFKVNLNENLRNKVLKKMKFFYYFFNIKYLFISLIILVPIFGMVIFKTTNTFWVKTISGKARSIYVYIDPIILVLFILYLMSESQKFKKYFLGKDLLKTNFNRKNNNEIGYKIDGLFEREEAYKDPNFNLTQAAAIIKESPKILSRYILEKEDMSFVNYINMLRVREFKSLLIDKENYKYDLLSLSKKAGFKSKASFYRIFKNIEGITPGEYKNRLDR